MGLPAQERSRFHRPSLFRNVGPGRRRPEGAVTKVRRLIPKWVKDIGRTIDYLQTRQDMDTESVAYMGRSLGALLGPVFAVLEERIRMLILLSGGAFFPAAQPKPPGTWFPHVKIPVLMLNGRFDYMYPVETRQKPMFDLLGTPPENKRHIVYDAGHAPFPRTECIRDILDWLDQYQGSSDGRSK